MYEDMPRPPGEAKDDSEDDEEVTQRRRSFSESLISLIEKQKNPDEDEEDEEDDEESLENNKSFAGRARRSLKRLFPKIVDKPNQSTEKPEEPGVEKPGTEDLFIAPEKNIIPPVETPSVSLSEAEAPAETREPETLPGRSEPEHPEELERVSEPVETEPPGPPGRAIMPLDGSVTSTGAEQTPEQLPPKRGTRAALLAFWGSFLAGELFSRSRDRKLRRENVRQQREIEKLKKSQQKAEAESMLKDGQEQQISHRLAGIEAQRASNTEKLFAQPVDELERSTQVFERPTPGPEKQAEAVSPLSASDLHPERNKEFTVHDRNARPDVVLEQVELAAEKNIPIESLYERRQEIKDEQGDLAALSAHYGQHQPGGASPVSSVLDSPEFDKARVVAEQARQPIAASQNRSVYKRAAKGGFWAAILVVIVLIAIALLR